MCNMCAVNLLVDDNPVEDAMIMTDNENNFDLIMKDSVV